MTRTLSIVAIAFALFSANSASAACKPACTSGSHCSHNQNADTYSCVPNKAVMSPRTKDNLRIEGSTSGHLVTGKDR